MVAVTNSWHHARLPRRTVAESGPSQPGSGCGAAQALAALADAVATVDRRDLEAGHCRVGTARLTVGAPDGGIGAAGAARPRYGADAKCPLHGYAPNDRNGIGQSSNRQKG